MSLTKLNFKKNIFKHKEEKMLLKQQQHHLYETVSVHIHKRKDVICIYTRAYIDTFRVRRCNDVGVSE